MSSTSTTASDDEDEYVRRLVGAIAAENGVALDKGDPIMVLQTATRRILKDVLKDVQVAQKDIMTLQQAEMELASKRWRQEAKASAETILHDVEVAARGAVSDAADLAAKAASDRIIAALQRHEQAMNRLTTIVSIVMTIAVIAATAVLLH